jgi:hypothetical protein
VRREGDGSRSSKVVPLGLFGWIRAVVRITSTIAADAFLAAWVVSSRTCETTPVLLAWEWMTSLDLTATPLESRPTPRSVEGCADTHKCGKEK